ncbi:uncharacterized protein RCC_09729 [Ramularia collo-cygni]|uniref:Metallo-beta-lactamase domain-containing protein n=1 Tax=Ramularia collo-cygni TaxID=112498 RepID=A0A2D3VFS2_9PEZI|nr:uncharacterized protein RCC_09729 [Ramularia collo-cygni]CZT24012.1 uncharacterized protein RCC_09729 [Ramularia collo-cygni]
MEIAVDNNVQQPKVHCIFSPANSTWCYIIADRASGHAIIIDPLLSRDHTGAIASTVPDLILEIVHSNNYTVDHVLETNAHEEYPSAAWYLRNQLLEKRGRAPRVAVQKSLRIVQRIHARKYGIKNKFWTGEFDGRFVDGEVLGAGSLRIQVIHLPGRSQDHVGYVIGDNLFAGDCCFHTRNHFHLHPVVQDCLMISIKRLQSMSPKLRIWTTRGCSSRPEGCVGEFIGVHGKNANVPVAGGIEQGLVA